MKNHFRSIERKTFILNYLLFTIRRTIKAQQSDHENCSQISSVLLERFEEMIFVSFDYSISHEQLYHFSWQDVQRNCLRIYLDLINWSHTNKKHSWVSEVLHSYTKANCRLRCMNTDDHEASLRSQTSITEHENRRLRFISFSQRLFHFFNQNIENKIIAAVRKILSNSEKQRYVNLSLEFISSLTYLFSHFRNSAKVLFKFSHEFI